MQSNLSQELSEKQPKNNKASTDLKAQIQHIEKQEFDLGLAPDAAYVKTGEDFIVGDVVVRTDPEDPDYLYEVVFIDAISVKIRIFLEAKAHGIWLSHKDVRSATPAELKAKRRLDPPVALFVSGEYE